MGRPYWATDLQWAWLMPQAIEYMRIRNVTYAKKSDKSKAFKIFWTEYFSEWARQWPSPGLTSVVHEELLSGDETSSDSDNDTPAKDGEDAPKKQKQASKKNETLTVRTVRKFNHKLRE